MPLEMMIWPWEKHDTPTGSSNAIVMASPVCDRKKKQQSTTTTATMIAMSVMKPASGCSFLPWQQCKALVLLWNPLMPCNDGIAQVDVVPPSLAKHISFNWSINCSIGYLPLGNKNNDEDEGNYFFDSPPHHSKQAPFNHQQCQYHHQVDNNRLIG